MRIKIENNLIEQLKLITSARDFHWNLENANGIYIKTKIHHLQAQRSHLVSGLISIVTVQTELRLEAKGLPSISCLLSPFEHEKMTCIKEVGDYHNMKW